MLVVVVNGSVEAFVVMVKGGDDAVVVVVAGEGVRCGCGHRRRVSLSSLSLSSWLLFLPPSAPFFFFVLLLPAL